MTQILREHCCLILDRNSLKQDKDFYKGTFIPVNGETISWLSKFDIFVKSTIQASGYPVEVGPNRPDIRYSQAYDALATLGNIDETKVGLFILSTYRDINSNSYSVTFKVSGPRSEAATALLLSDEPFILATKGISDDHYVGDAIHRKITNIVGLHLLRNSELTIPVSDDVIKACSLPETETLKESIMEAEQKASVVTVKTERHLSDQTICGNHDVGLVVKLNLAAGNFIDHDSVDTSVEDYERNIKRQLNIDASECGELWEAYIAGDMSMFRDALVDKRITLNGFQPIVPFPMIMDYRIGVENNFTRFDSSHGRALDTQAKYKALGVATYIVQVDLEDPTNPTTYFVNKVLDECVGTDGNTYAKDKWVKSAYFTDDSFKHIDGMISNDAASIAERYMETRKMLKGLLKRIDHSFTAAIAKLED